MKKRIICSLLAVILLMTITCISSIGANTGEEKKVLRIGYCEGEVYYEFDYALYNLILGLKEYEMVDGNLSEINEKTVSSDIWAWISKNNKSGWKVEFVPNAFATLSDAKYSNMTPEELSSNLDKLYVDNKIDLIITMGTTAALTVKDLPSKTPLMNFVAADALKSGIVNSSETSNTPNVWAQLDTDSFKRSITVMDDIFKPKTVGIVYADNEEAYIYSGADVIDKFCKENNINVIKEFVDDDIGDEEYDEYIANLISAHKKIADKVDVFIMTTSLVEVEDFKAIYEPFIDAKKPIYSINSADDVENGALIAAESSDFVNVGRFGADMMKRFFSGEKLEDLPQIYKTAPFLVINFSTAKKIGFKPSFNMLLSSNKIYIDKEQ